jgi:SAM-dependent methyltransferase
MTPAALAGIHADIERYYSAQVARYGATPLGVDWSCVATQQLRFVQLLKICDFSVPRSIDDLGCGYGALLDFISERQPAAQLDYLGIDLSSAMIRRARRRHRGRPRRRFTVGGASPRIADYAIASGVMNVKLDHSREIWEAYLAQILRGMHHASRRGFAVNFMAEVPAGQATAQLYRTGPDKWLRYCRDALGCAVEVVSGYGMREFTLLARHGGIAA